MVDRHHYPLGGIAVESKAVARLAPTHDADPKSEPYSRASQRLAGFSGNLCTRSRRHASRLDRGLMMSANVGTVEAGDCGDGRRTRLHARAAIAGAATSARATNDELLGRVRAKLSGNKGTLAAEPLARKLSWQGPCGPHLNASRQREGRHA
jgi:hypothetical protein